MPQLIRGGHLYMAVPPLYSLRQGGKIAYARDDAHKEELLRTEFTGRGKVEIGRFKGLGEMMASQLKETTMDKSKRTLLRVEVEEGDGSETRRTVDDLMGTKPEARFRFITERAEFAQTDELDI
jgi:topoisomerase-4 subunit B